MGEVVAVVAEGGRGTGTEDPRETWPAIYFAKATVDVQIRPVESWWRVQMGIRAQQGRARGCEPCYWMLCWTVVPVL